MFTNEGFKGGRGGVCPSLYYWPYNFFPASRLFQYNTRSLLFAFAIDDD